ncbi:MAG: DUF3857 and transglutaminase domain-containing protein [Gemmatimonadota bacterium]|nr:DUF3857 and transglutaminase domain-containing protein [Gemmatimonadota bacterium]
MKRNIKHCAAVLAALFLAAVPFLAAAEQAPESLIEKLSSITGEKYPDANSVTVESRREVTYETDGTFLDRSYELVKVLTDAGKKSYGRASFGYSRKYDALRIEKARVIKPDGTVIEVPEEMIKDETHPALAMMNIYDSDVRVYVVTFKNLEIGDAIEYEILDSCFLAPMDGQYDLIETFQSTEPIVHKRVTVNGPSSRPLSHLVKDGQVGFESSEDQGRVSYTWEVRDVERIVSEPAMPGLLSFAPRLMASTLDSWDQISRWWAGMTGKFRDQNDSLRAVVDKITAGLKTDEEKVKAIYHFVAQKIRYMGLGTGKKAGFEPKPATETLATRYGVCRDVAVLMCSMLDVAGIQSSPVLTRAGELIDTEIPTIGFNHAIVAIADGGGGLHFLRPHCGEQPGPAALFRGGRLDAGLH